MPGKKIVEVDPPRAGSSRLHSHIVGDKHVGTPPCTRCSLGLRARGEAGTPRGRASARRALCAADFSYARDFIYWTSGSPVAES
eukprot:4423041-Prymnesium_polylepis.1